MNMFDIYEHPQLGRETVKRGFIWPAMLTFIWAFYKKMWAVGFALLGVEFLLSFLVGLIAPSEDAAGLLWWGPTLAFGVIVGFNASKWRGNHLTKKGYRLVPAVHHASAYPSPHPHPQAAAPHSAPAPAPAPTPAYAPAPTPAYAPVGTGGPPPAQSAPAAPNWEHYSDGGRAMGSYVDGKRNGHWVIHKADGEVQEGTYVNGEQHGHWVERHADGDVWEGHYVKDLMQGHWVIRHANGTVGEGSFANGLMNGHWVLRHPDGTVEQVTFRNGVPVE